MLRHKSGVAFAFLVVLSIAQVVWWLVFQFREADRFETAAKALAAGDRGTAAAALGVDENGALDDRFHRRRFMFATEGAFLGLCALGFVVFFYAALTRERRVLQERERFLAGATHEFKTPLATIRLGLQSVLDRRFSEEKQDEYLHAMVGEVDRLERGVTNLLAAAGLRGADPVRDFEVADLAADVREVFEEFEPRFAASGLDASLQVDDGLMVRRDRAAMLLVLRNLFDNAMRYSEGEGAVRVTSTRNGSHVELRIADEGLGIHADDLPRLFDAFSRGRTADHVGGSGLGLHLVHTYVDQHGGTVEALSDGPGTGSEFVVRLPIAESSR